MGAFGDFEKVKGRSLLSGNVGQLGTQMSHKDNVVNIVVVLVLVLLFVFVMVNVRVNRIATMEEATNAIHKCSSYTTHIYSLLLNLRHSNTPLFLSLFYFSFPLFFSFQVSRLISFFLFWNFLSPKPAENMERNLKCTLGTKF